VLRPSCPRCSEPSVDEHDPGTCPVHGRAAPLWRPDEPSYDSLAAHLVAAAGFPTYLPWPLSPGWRVSDSGVVTDRVGGGGTVHATLTACAGTSEPDGPVELVVVAEEPGTGLGARVAGTAGDPGHHIAGNRPSLRVLVDTATVPLWTVPTGAATAEMDRSVVAGEAFGRWLWLVLRPASALLLLHDDWILQDISGFGPLLVDLPYGGPAPAW
jgi:hypothetical protein